MLFELSILDINDFMKVGSKKNRGFRNRIYSFRNWWMHRNFWRFIV